MSRSGTKCPRCGNTNSLGRVFCSTCGVRLDLSRINTRVLAKGMRSPGDGTFRLFRLLLFLLLLAVVSLLLWPTVFLGESGTLRDARAVENKIVSIQRAQQAGLYVYELFWEREANAYLAEVLKRDKSISRSEGMRLGLDAISVSFELNELTVVVLASWGPLRLSYEVTGIPVIDHRGFRLEILSARWGHLPLPGRAGEYVGARVASVFSQMERERRMLDGLERFDVGKGKVRLVTKSRR